MFKFDGAEDRLGGVEGRAAAGERQLEEHVVDQITVTRHGHRYLFVKIGSSIKRLLDTFDGEVSVTPVHDLALVTLSLDKD